MYTYMYLYREREREPGANAEGEKKKRKSSADPGHIKSFARRVRPKTARAATQWEAIRDSFKLILQPRLSCPSSHEDVCGLSV